MLNLFIDDSIPSDASFGSVKEKAFTLLDPEQFPVVSRYMINAEVDETGFEWAYYASLSHVFKRNIRHLFSDLEFAGRVDDAPLLKAVSFLQEVLRQGKSPKQVKSSKFPTTFIPKGLQRYLFQSDLPPVPGRKDTQKRLDVDRYEFLVYRLLRNALEAGDVFVQDSSHSGVSKTT